MKKRGQIVLITLIVLIVALFSGYALLKIKEEIIKGELSKKVAVSRDFALTLNAICSYHHNIEVEYEIDLSRFIVEISEDSVKLYDAFLFVTLDQEGKIHGKDPNVAKYNFVCSQDINFVFDSPKKTTFSKKDGKIEVKAQK